MVEIKKQLKEEGIIQGLSLDIDDTIATTREMWAETLFKTFGNPEKLTFNQLIDKYGYIQNVPYWQEKSHKEWIVKARHSNKLQENIGVIPLANTLIQKIDKIAKIALYLTARPEAVRQGTINWINKHGFPLRIIIFSPTNYEFAKLSLWKGQTLASLFPEVTGIIEDNPNVIASIPKNYEGIVYYINNKNHERKDIRIVPCKNLTFAHQQIIKNHC